MPELNTLTYLAILLLGGLFFGRLAKKLHLPNVTGYLVGGLLLGPSVLNVIPAEALHGFELISEMALAFIAFTIGLSFKASYFKRVGATPIVIAIFEALMAVFLVQGALLLFGFDPAFSIILGAIAAATAPAATIMVIKQYRAKGPLTETLMSVVAIDDAVALIAFIVLTPEVTLGSALIFLLTMATALIRDIRYYRYAVRFGMDELNDVNELAAKYPEARPMINRKQKTGSGEDETAGDN